MNYMEQVAKMLGVEIGEEFLIEGNSGKYIIHNVGLFSFCGGSRKDELLNNILTGLVGIKKLPWKPKKGENYCAVCTSGEPKWYYWSDSTSDCLCYKIGNCFKTKENVTPEIIKKYIDFLNNDERIIEI